MAHASRDRSDGCGGAKSCSSSDVYPVPVLQKKGNYADLELVRLPSSSTLAADGIILTLNTRKEKEKKKKNVSRNEGTGLGAGAIPGLRASCPATFLHGHGSYMACEKQ